eukprot:jgi/Mesen1/2071/ME000151S01333
MRVCACLRFCVQLYVHFCQGFHGVKSRRLLANFFGEGNEIGAATALVQQAFEIINPLRERLVTEFAQMRPQPGDKEWKAALELEDTILRRSVRSYTLERDIIYNYEVPKDLPLSRPNILAESVPYHIQELEEALSLRTPNRK